MNKPPKRWHATRRGKKCSGKWTRKNSAREMVSDPSTCTFINFLIRLILIRF